MRTPGSLLLLATLLAGCTSARMINTVDPNRFGRNLFDIAENGSSREWASQLTKERREMGDAYVEKHFTAWRKTLLELKKSFEAPVGEIDFRVNDNGLEFFFEKEWHLLLRVTTEDGALKINQD
jgi:hypothetical protein